MELTAQQEKQLSDALLKAFPSRTSLSRMVRFGLGVNLEDMTAGGLLPDTVFELIRWAEGSNKVNDLIKAARESNPGNPQLRTFEATMGWASQPAGNQVSSVSLSGPQARHLNQALLRAF